MPLYTYACECGHEYEEIVKYEERDTVLISCEKCRKRMKRAVDGAKLGKPPYQMAAVMGDGRVVPGHFGKEAKRNRKD